MHFPQAGMYSVFASNFLSLQVYTLAWCCHMQIGFWAIWIVLYDYAELYVFASMFPEVTLK